VLQEIHDAVTRELRPGLTLAEAQREFRALLPWAPIDIRLSMVIVPVK